MDNKIICDEKNETNKISRLNRKGRVGRVGGIKQDYVIKDIVNEKCYGSDFDLDELSIFLPKNELSTQLKNEHNNNTSVKKSQSFKLLENSIANNIEFHINLQNEIYKKRKIIPFISSFVKNENMNNDLDNNNSMENID